MNLAHQHIHKLFITFKTQDLLNYVGTDGFSIPNDSQPSIIISEATRQAMRQVLNIVIFRLDISERPINDTASSLANSNLSPRITTATKASLGIKDWRMCKIFPVKSPVPVRKFASVLALVA